MEPPACKKHMSASGCTAAAAEAASGAPHSPGYEQQQISLHSENIPQGPVSFDNEVKVVSNEGEESKAPLKAPLPQATTQHTLSVGDLMPYRNATGPQHKKGQGRSKGYEPQGDTQWQQRGGWHWRSDSEWQQRSSRR